MAPDRGVGTAQRLDGHGAGAGDRGHVGGVAIRRRGRATGESWKSSFDDRVPEKGVAAARCERSPTRRDRNFGLRRDEAGLGGEASFEHTQHVEVEGPRGLEVIARERPLQGVDAIDCDQPVTLETVPRSWYVPCTRGVHPRRHVVDERDVAALDGPEEDRLPVSTVPSGYAAPRAFTARS